MYNFDRYAFIGQQNTVIESFFVKYTIFVLFDSLFFTDFVRLNILSFLYGFDRHSESDKPTNRSIIPLCLWSNACLKSGDLSKTHQKDIMQSILRALKRNGYDLNDKWQYHGSDPHKVREELKGMGSDTEIRVLGAAVSIVLAVNFYGTTPVKQGNFSAKKQQKYDKEWYLGYYHGYQQRRWRVGTFRYSCNYDPLRSTD